MRTIEFTIPGKPIAKGRPQFRAVHTGVMYFNKTKQRQEEKILPQTRTPADSVNFENLVRLAFVSSYDGDPTPDPVSIVIRAFFPIPKSAKKADRDAAVHEILPHTKTPDGDNIVKSVLDGLNTVAFVDDRQVYQLTISKWYSHRPRTEVTISIQSLEEAAWQRQRHLSGRTNGHSMSPSDPKTKSPQTTLELSSSTASS